MNSNSWCGCDCLGKSDPRYEAYAKKVGTVTSNVWYDPNTKKTFGVDITHVNSPINEAGFYTTKVDFQNNNKFNEVYLENKFKDGKRKVFSEAFKPERRIKTDEMIYFDHPLFKEVEGKKILIVGGGPTTKYVNWNAKDYDHIFTCNFFFRSPKFKGVKVSYATLCDSIPLFSKEMTDYAKDSDTLFAFQDFNPCKRNVSQLQKFETANPGRTTFTHPRYRSVEGTMSRTIVPAVLMKPSEVHIVGMDGLLPTDKVGNICDHAFQPGKKYEGALDYHLYKRQFVILWDYLLNDIGKGIKFQNLGEGHPNNQWSDISKKEFPLEVLKNGF